MDQSVIETEKKPNLLAFKSAVIYSIYFLILIYIFKWVGINQNDPNISIGEKIISSATSYIPFILAIVFVQTTYRKDLGGYISLGKAFSAGFKVAAYSGLFIAILLILYYKFFDTTAFEKIMTSALQTAAGDKTKIKGIEMMRSYMPFFIGFGAAITYTMFGLIISLVNAAIIKRERV